MRTLSAEIFRAGGYSEEAEREVTRFWKVEQRTIILLTIQELLD
jgi:hypothetical protein